MNEEKNKNIKIGLEIHFQVKGRKLFCSCEGEESDNYRGKIVRRLRASAGEFSNTDLAAIQEERKRNEFEYLITDNSCLVEMDEEPPHSPSQDAISGAFIVSFILGCTPVDNIDFMRKMVIDGSNTSGFQRTGIIGINGVFHHNDRKIGIASVTLEEEACKKIEQKGNVVTYSLDRLGIPLIEVSTEPDIHSPREAREIAEALGIAVRRSGYIRREVSSIRQDVNISVDSGNRVEIKGVQSLSQIQEVLEYEIERQTILNEIAAKLRGKGVRSFRLKPLSINEIANSWKSNIVIKAISEKKEVIAFRLDGLSGFLNNGKYRLGREIAERLRASGIGGIIHSDELPNYGITSENMVKLKEYLSCGEEDAFAFIIVDKDSRANALKIIEERLNEALIGVPAETRAATPDGTKFLRPLPGKSRMYPETDIPIIKVDHNFLDEIKKKIPPTVKERASHLMNLGVSEQEAMNAIWKEYDDILENFIREFGNPKSVAKLLAVVFSKQEKDLDKAARILGLLKEGLITKDVLEDLYNESDKNLSGISKSKEESLESVIKEIVDSNIELVRERGNDSFKPLMGEAMKKLRGKVDGSKVSEALKKEIESRIREMESDK
ncbi:MAG: Glu-tRNA(Gln) amidotransferase subunit GatE [Thermoplasmata archaeon]